MKKWTLILGSFCFCIFLFLSILPSFLSTQLAKPIVTTCVQYGADLDSCSYESLSLSWFSECRIRNVEVALKPQKTRCFIKEVLLCKSLFSLLANPRDLGKVEIYSPQVIVPLHKTFSNVQSYDISKQKALLDENARIPFTENVPMMDQGSFSESIMRCSCSLFDASLAVVDAQNQTLLLLNAPFTYFNGNCSMDGAFVFKTETSVWEGLKGSEGIMSSSLSFKNGAGFKGECELDLPFLSTDTVATLFLSPTLNKKKIQPLAELIGPTCSLKFSWNGNTQKEGGGTFSCSSDHVTASFAYRLLDGSNLIIGPSNFLRVDVTKEAYTNLLEAYDIPLPYQLQQTLKVSATLNSQCSINLPKMAINEPFAFQITSPDTLWIYKSTPFKTNLILQSDVSSKPTCNLKLSVKKEATSTVKNFLAINGSYKNDMCHFVLSSETHPFFPTVSSDIQWSDNIMRLQAQVHNTEKKPLAFMNATLDKEHHLQSKIELFPAFAVFSRPYLAPPFQALFKNFKKAEILCDIKNITNPYCEEKSSLLFDSETLQVDCILSCKDSEFHLQNRAQTSPALQLKMTDDALQMIHPSLRLQAPASLSLNSCSLQIDPTNPWNLNGDIQINCDAISAQSHTRSYSIQPTTISGHIDNGTRALFSIKPSPNKTESAKTSLSGTCTIERKGPLETISLDSMVIKGSLDVHFIPSDILKALSPKLNSLADDLSPEFSVSTSFTSDKLKNGSLQLQVKAPNASLSLESAHIRDGSLYLTSPLLTKIVIDKKRGSELLKQFIPILSSKPTKPHEITLTISPEGTKLPLRNCSLQDLNLPKIVLEIGKIEVKPCGVIEKLLKVFKAPFKKTTQLWITPIHASMKEGTLSLERFDILAAEALHLIIWGDADLSQNTLAMYAGVPEDSFKKLGLYLSIPRPLIIPIKGTFDNPEVNTIKITARVAGASASTYGVLEGPLGLVGGALQMASTLGDDEIPIPKPLELPFPWEKK